MKISDLKKIDIFHVNTTFENAEKLNKALGGPKIINHNKELSAAPTTFFQKDGKTWRVHFNFEGGGNKFDFEDIEFPKDRTPTNVYVEIPGLKELKDVCRYLEECGDGFKWVGGQKPTGWEPSKSSLPGQLFISSDKRIGIAVPRQADIRMTLEHFFDRCGITNPLKVEKTPETEMTNPPRFDKQVLVRSKEEYDNLMLYLESIGYTWASTDKPTGWNPVHAGLQEKYNFIVELNKFGHIIHDKAINNRMFQNATWFLQYVGWFPKKAVEDSQALEGQKEVEMVKRGGEVSKGTLRFSASIKVSTQEEMADLMKFLDSQGYKWNSGASCFPIDGGFKRNAPDTINTHSNGSITYGGQAELSAKRFLTDVGYYDSLLRVETSDKVTGWSGIVNPFKTFSKEKEMVGSKSNGLVRRAANYAFVNPFKKSWNFAGKALPFVIFYGTILGASYAGWSVYQNPAEIGKKIQEALPFEVKFKTENNSQG